MHIPCAQLHGPRARRRHPPHPGAARAQRLDPPRGGVEAIQGNRRGLKTPHELGPEVTMMQELNKKKCYMNESIFREFSFIFPPMDVVSLIESLCPRGVR